MNEILPCHAAHWMSITNKSETVDVHWGGETNMFPYKVGGLSKHGNYNEI